MSYNIFNQAHLPLKLALISGCTTLSQNTLPDVSSASTGIIKIEEVLRIFKAQVKYEASYILPLIFEYEPSIWAMYTSEHHKANNLARNLEHLVAAFHKSTNTSGKLELMEQVSKSYNEFVLVNFHHMDDEEPVLNEILWRYYSNSFIKQMASGVTETAVQNHPATLPQIAAAA